MSLATSNIFSALDTKKKKKSKSSQDKSDKKKPSSKPERPLPVQPHLFSAGPKPSVSNWADTDEEDDFEDDIGPLPESWLPTGGANGESQQKEAEEATDSEEEARVEEIHEALGLELTKEDEDDEDEEEPDNKAPLESGTDAPAEVPVERAAQPQGLPVEKQLSKKEQKRLELEEMNRVLAELGIAPEAQEEAASHSPEPQKAVEEHASNGEVTAAGEAGLKKKKKKDKEKRKAEPQETAAAQSEAHDSEPEEPATINPSEAKKLLAKKLAQAKKANGPSSASLAAREAKERAAKKAKVKDKKHYNQAPTR